MRLPLYRLTAVCLIALMGMLAAAALLATAARGQAPAEESAAAALEQADPGPQHPVSAQILTRLRADGRLEFCLRTESSETVCPRGRFLNLERAPQDRWLHSSAAAWEVPIEAERIINAPADEPSPSSVGESCEPDFERMLAATWRVDTTWASGTAFHIGGGRFLTAHHVIEDAPPFVLLSNGTREMAAAVLGSIPELDTALLQVYDASAVSDLPAVELRVPTADDLGAPVYLVGYPDAGPLTVSLGGVVSRVWADEILTTSASRGGNSGGPMFDACGDVLGVLWAGNPNANHSHSGSTLLDALDALTPTWPRLPTNLPDSLRLPPGWVIWHFGPEPPEQVDCGRIDGDFWLGAVGPEPPGMSVFFGSGTDPLGNECTGPDGLRVLGFKAPKDADPDWAPDTCISAQRSGSYQGWAAAVLHESTESFGTLGFDRLAVPMFCSPHYTHQIRIHLGDDSHSNWQWTLIGEDDSRVSDPDQSRYGRSFAGVAVWPLELPAGFEPVWIELHDQITDERFRIKIVTPEEAAGPTLSVDARVAAMIESDTGRLRLCLQPSGSEQVCPARNALPLERLATNKWFRTSSAAWAAPIDDAQLPEHAEFAEIVGYSCALTAELGDLAWQLSTVRAEGTAVYVGQRQFLASSSLFDDEQPWAVVARGDVALPVVRVSTDARNGLTLLEVIGPVDRADLGSPLALSTTAEPEDGSRLVLVGYPWGDAKRFTVSLGQIADLTDRSFSFPAWYGWYRAGAPVLDPCSLEVLGVAVSHARALRSGEVLRSIRQLRSERTAPQVAAADGPPLYGSAALRQSPVYVGTEQPDFGGWICNVRDSERYDVVYAIYLARITGAMLIATRDGAYQEVQTCGWGGRVRIVEYRADEAPDAICVEPRRPDSPLSTIQIEFEAPDGIELLQLTEHVIEPCPGFRSGWDSRWASDVYLKLRVTRGIELLDLVFTFFDSEGKELYEASGLRSDWDADPDVIAGRVDLPEGAELAKLVVRVYVQEPGG